MIDLQHAIDATDNPDIQRLYENLMRGSRIHLRAFVSLIEEVTGEEYSAQLLDQEVLDAIVSDSLETGRS